MASTGSPYEVTAIWYDPRSAYWSTDYMKKLLIERHGIRAALENPGGSVIITLSASAADVNEVASYSSVIGNDFHLDLLEAEREVNELAIRDRIELLAWCDGLNPSQAAQWANEKGGRIRTVGKEASRKRVQRAIVAVTEAAQANDDA